MLILCMILQIIIFFHISAFLSRRRPSAGQNAGRTPQTPPREMAYTPPGIGSVFARDRADTRARWRTSRAKMAYIPGEDGVHLFSPLKEAETAIFGNFAPEQKKHTDEKENNRSRHTAVPHRSGDAHLLGCVQNVGKEFRRTRTALQRGHRMRGLHTAHGKQAEAQTVRKEDIRERYAGFRPTRQVARSWSCATQDAKVAELFRPAAARRTASCA